MPSVAPACATFSIDDLVRNDPRQQFRAYPSITLDRAVNPVMKRDRWIGDVQYDLLLPGFQICSVLTMSPDSQRYYSGVCTSNPRPVSYDHPSGKLVAIFRQTGPLSKAVETQLKQFWTDFAPYLTLKIDNLPPGTYGVTVRDRSKPIKRGVFPVEGRGHGSTITISRSSYNGLLFDVEQYKRDPTSAAKQDRMFTSYFGFAKLLAHEIAHAVSMARWPASDEFSMPFENNRFTEDGLCWEVCMFGGTVNTHDSMAWVCDWPSAAAVESYLRTRGPGIAITAPLESLTESDCVNKWRIPPCFIRALFQQEFWSTTLPTLGDKPLHIPKVLGLRSAPKGLGTINECYCESCFHLKDFALRQYIRGNGPIKPEGHHVVALTISESERAKAEEAAERKQRQTRCENSLGTLPAQRTLLPKGDAYIPTKNDTTNHRFPPPACRRGEWQHWFGPRDAEDPREFHSFGLPTGFKSLSDGSVVAEKHVRAVAAYLRGQEDETGLVATQGR